MQGPVRAWFTVAALLPLTAAAQLVSYVDSTTYGRPAGEIDMRLGGSAASVDADMKLVADGGKTRVMPRITTQWAPHSRLEMRTVVRSGDLNAQSVSAAIDTRIAFRPSARFIERIETSLQRADRRDRETVKLNFARFDTGLGLFGGDSLDFRAGLQHERAGDRVFTSSNLKSTVGLGEALSMSSELRLLAAAAAGGEHAALESRLVYRMPFDFVESVEGEVRRGAEGERQTLGLKLPAYAGKTPRGSAYRVTGKALVREVLLANGTESRRLGFETKFSGIFASPVGGRNALSLEVERGLGSEELRNASLSYDHNWAPAEEIEIELRLKTRRRGDSVDPSLDLNWSARF